MSEFHGWPDAGVRRLPQHIYTDRDNFQRELDKIFFANSWNYVALSCEVPEPGDYILSSVGNVGVIVSRDRKGAIRVFVNRCTHRGARLCEKRKGNNKLFTCPYHEWRFNLEGRLVGVPLSQGVKGKGGMSAQFDPQNHGLKQLNVCERHGVVFASFSNDMVPLETYLGPKVLRYFDRVCDGRPLKVIGKHKHVVAGNWKLQIENVKDTVHAAILHSFFTLFGIWRSDQETEIVVEDKGMHSVLASTATFSKQQTHSEEVDSEFSLLDPSLIAHEAEFSHATGAVMTIWPNLIFLQQLNCLVMRHVEPVSQDKCVKTWTFFAYEDEDPALTARRVKQANLLGASGLVTIDDNEILASCQVGLQQQSQFECAIEYGEGTSDCDHMVSESAIRGFYNYYRQVMEL
ncbi:aromatic ring-hydroxylating oxygenase subunit alpha [Pseudoalteromonas rubra]|uniref:Aromatic-ring-hydroxylating dioxygenase n=1 Tax=Pseudoalteromonas rubra TaxID=43658 RepID=A0A0F4QD68_9GAMM|nr:Rieske 2Fe-2S domain-containing protein [Pseudoalteromonas rubra]KJZ05631.1 aromatic-ring-hydroxylating dioxygenase [Pseudoalteromonas rubra]